MSSKRVDSHQAILSHIYYWWIFKFKKCLSITMIVDSQFSPQGNLEIKNPFTCLKFDWIVKTIILANLNKDFINNSYKILLNYINPMKKTNLIQINEVLSFIISPLLTQRYPQLGLDSYQQEVSSGMMPFATFHY